MFRISRKLDYGLQLMIALASNPENHSQTTGSLSEKLSIPLPFLYQISHALIRFGLIKAQSGPHGGLQLGKPADQITVMQIITAIEGSIAINPCLNLGESGEPACVTSLLWQNLEGNITNFFENAHLHTLISHTAQAS